MRDAFDVNASDIHLTVGLPPMFRVNGVLRQAGEELLRREDTYNMAMELMDDRRRTQFLDNGEADFSYEIENVCRFRVNVFKQSNCVAAALRLISNNIPSFEDLRLPDVISDLAMLPRGLVLVTGPTGSGKSTTLHASLQQIASIEKNVITIEDPVEYNADNINQIQVNTKVGLTFASALRSVLRQDPDIVMVGEIRDKETAQISIQAALTGHLLLSTLHTNNATAAVTRLADMGIENFLISSTLLGVLAQRLVRKLCPKCKTPETISDSFADEFGLQKNMTLYKACGCEDCGHSGYVGRIAVGEILALDDELKELISITTNDHTIRELAVKKGMIPLSHKLKKLLSNGETSLEEAIRIGIKEA